MIIDASNLSVRFRQEIVSGTAAEDFVTIYVIQDIIFTPQGEVESNDISSVIIETANGSLEFTNEDLWVSLMNGFDALSDILQAQREQDSIFQEILERLRSGNYEDDSFKKSDKVTGINWHRKMADSSYIEDKWMHDIEGEIPEIPEIPEF